MEELTISQITAVASEVKRRVGLLNLFKERCLDDRTYEIRGEGSIHRLLVEQAMWIVDEHYWLMFSNSQLRTIVTKELAKEDKRHEKERPDFVSGTVDKKLIVIEIKRPSHTLTDELDAERRASFAVATEELDRMARIVDDLLLLTHLDEGMELRREPVELELVLREALLRAMLLAPRDVHVETEPGLYALADHERVLQVLTNLVTNAVQHTDETSRIVLASARQNGHVLVRVSDNGDGIATEDLPHVFERLYRGRTAQADVPEGSGLGLAIAASITAAMDGSIEVESMPGRSTTFTITLPVARSEPGPAFASPRRRVGEGASARR